MKTDQTRQLLGAQVIFVVLRAVVEIFRAEVRVGTLDSFMTEEIVSSVFVLESSFEPRREKTGFLHMRKQRRRTASR